MPGVEAKPFTVYTFISLGFMVIVKIWSTQFKIRSYKKVSRLFFINVAHNFYFASNYMNIYLIYLTLEWKEHFTQRFSIYR